MPTQKKTKPLIGIIGMGFVGSSYAHDFKNRGFSTICYAKEAPHKLNRDLIKTCDIVFIAVPTPTTPKGFDNSIIKDVVKLVGKGKIAVIKSTLIPGTTELVQKENPKMFVMHSPEFLTEVTARHDAQHPYRNIIGIPKTTPVFKQKARKVLSVLPHAPYSLVCKAQEAELIKYGGNAWFYHKVIFINELYDLAVKQNADYSVIRNALAADPRIGATHLDPIHKSGRGAGGNCFIKDFAAFARFYEKTFPKDTAGITHFRATEQKNINLLTQSGKDVRLLQGIYGNKFGKKKFIKKKK